jgi:signal transduction histidine kinase
VLDGRSRDRLAAALRILRGPRVFGFPAVVVLGVAWTLVGTLSFVRTHLDDAGRTLDAAVLSAYLISLACYLPWAFLGTLVIDLERRFPLGRAGWVPNLAVLAAASLPMCYAAWSMSIMLAASVQAVFGLPVELQRLAWVIPGGELLGHELLYWSTVLASRTLQTALTARESERRAARLILEKSQLETSLRQAELDALRMRLRPHFLFNSLQNIAVLTEHDPQTGARMLTRLAELLRASLAGDGRPETTLEAEIALTNAYLAVEQMRFGDRLSSIVEVGPGTEDALVPTFLLQPLVENAIRHGLERVAEPGVIAIRSRRDDGSLVLTVTDNGAGPPGETLSETALGIGLGATCERLARLYPGRHTFSMHAGPEGGTEVRITLPLRREVTGAGAGAGGGDAAAADR